MYYVFCIGITLCLSAYLSLNEAISSNAQTALFSTNQQHVLLMNFSPGRLGPVDARLQLPSSGRLQH